MLQFYGTLEQCVLVGQCVKLLDSSSDMSEDHTALLALSVERLRRHLPDEQVHHNTNNVSDLVNCVFKL